MTARQLRTRCVACGYKLIRSRKSTGDGHVIWMPRCVNPVHPRRPQCPRCGSERNHQVLSGGVHLKCADATCGHVFDPKVGAAEELEG